MSAPVVIDPSWFVEQERRMAAMEQDLLMLRFEVALLALRPYAVRLPRDAPRDPRVRRRRPRQRGHL